MSDVENLRKNKFPDTREPVITKHPRTLGWFGTMALALGGSNQSLFLIGALVVGQGSIHGQGSAAIPLLMLGLALGWMAAPGWTELALMWPNRVGGIAATCAEAFRPYSPVLANLAGTCYWWGWVPTCGLTALLSAAAIHQWYLPHISIPGLASALVLLFMSVNLCGVKWVTRMTLPIAAGSALLAFLSGIVPVMTGHVDWHQASTFHLTTPFPGLFGSLTSFMAGLYLVGFAAPAFEAAACHVGETVNPNRNVPRAMFASGAMATVYFVVLPVVWLGTLGLQPLAGDLAQTLGPTFAPLLGSGAKAAAVWFMMLNMFHGTIQPLAGAARTLAQLSEDGLLPRIFGRRSRLDVPWVATILTASMAIAFLLAGDPIWLVAAANLTYLISICLASIAVWLLRRDAPDLPRPWRAPRGTVELGLVASFVWLVATVLGFEQFGLPTVLAGLTLAYSGSVLYALRRWSDRRRSGEQRPFWSLHTKLTGAMVVVLSLDSAGYFLAIRSIRHGHPGWTAALEDIFVAVALLTITVGLVLPGMVAYAADEVARAANRLATGTLADFGRAMEALGRGDISGAHAHVDMVPITTHSQDEVGAMAASFNLMQVQIARAAVGLDGAREGLGEVRLALEQQVQELHLAQERFRSIFENAVEGIYRATPEGRLIAANPALAQIFGCETLEQLHQFLDSTSENYLDPQRRERFVQHMQDGDGVTGFEYQAYCRDGRVVWISESAWCVRDSLGSLLFYEGMLQDITDRKQLEAEKEHQLTEALERADRDPLTGLLNHRAFHRRFNEEADRAQRTGSSLAIAVLDLDNFKFFNEAYGHLAGDDVLRQTAEALRSCCRSYDTPARFGGDEFALLLPETGANAKQLRQDLLARLQNLTFRPEGSPVALPLGLSVGIALFPDEAPTRLEVLEIADTRLRRSKSGGDGENVADRLCEQLSHSIAGFGMLNALVTAVDTKDRYTRRHSEDVLRYSLRLARALGLDEDFLHTVQVAALLHDVGKIGVPDAILRKPGKLTDEEFEAVKQHPLMGAIMVGAVAGFEKTLDAIRHHHERWDGNGYPFGLKGDETPLIARLMAVADAFSAMTMDRPYRKGMPREKALEILREGAGTQWDPTCVGAFLSEAEAILAAS